MEELLRQLAAIDDQIDLLLMNDDLTAEQRATHDRLQGERKTVQTKIGREEDRQARAAERAQLQQRQSAVAVAAERQANRVTTTRVVDADPPTRNGPAASSPAMPDQLPALTGVPGLPGDGAALVGNLLPSVNAYGVPTVLPYFGKLGVNGAGAFAGAQSATVFNPQTKQHDTVIMSGEQRAYRFGMWALSALGQQYPGTFGRTDACRFASRWVSTFMPTVNAAVLSTDSSGYQFTIPPEFSRDIIVLRETYGVARRLLRREPMTSDKKMIPRRQSGVTAYWTSEGGIITPSNKVWNDVELIAKDLTAISVVSAQVNADTIVPWAADLADEIAYAFSLAEDNAAFIGDGTSTYGKVVGIAQKLKTPDSSSNASAGLVTGTSTGWGGLQLKDFQKLIGTLPQYADTGNTTFVSHRTFFYTIVQPLLTALGGVNLTEATRGTNQAAQEGYAARPLVLGYPWTFSQVMPNATASAQIPCYFGDLGKGAAFGDRQQMQIAFSDQGYVAGVSLFERNLLGIRGTERIDINNHDCGTSSSGTPASTAGPICGLLTG